MRALVGRGQSRRIHRVRRPLVGLSLLAVAGIWLGAHSPLSPVTGMVAVALLLGLALACVRHSYSTVPLLLAWLVLACSWASMHLHHPSPAALPHLLSHACEDLEIDGIIVGDPYPYRQGTRTLRYAFPVELVGIHRLDWWQRARGRVWLTQSVSEPKPYAYGQRWTWAGLLQQDASGSVGRPFRFRADRTGGCLVERHRGMPLKAWCLRTRRACARILSLGLSDFPDCSGLLQALLLGYRHALTPAWRDAFARTGTMHIFAISGLHVGVMALIITALLRTAGVSRRRWILVLGPVLVLYTMSTGMKASAVRACLMALVFWSGPWVGRKPDGPSSLAFAALLILAVAPFQLFSAGFTLSFAVVSGILLMYGRLYRPLIAPFERDPMRLSADRGWEQKGRAVARYLVGIIALTVSAWLASAPLTARFFNLVSPVGLLGNLLVVPWALLVVVTGCLSLVFGAAWPLLAEVFNHANRVFITGLLALVDYIRGIPGGSFFVCAPSIAVVAGWYGLLLAVFLSPTGKRTRIILPACALLAALYFAGLPAVPFIDVMDVGLGQAAVLRIPGGGHVLVDAGPAYREEAVLRHLRRLGINRLHALVLSHPDARHVGAASAVLDAFTVDELWCSPHRGRSGLYRRVLEQAADKGVRIRRLECGSHGVLEEGIVWKVFHPSGTVCYRKGDDASLVIRFAREGWGVLLGGGANRYVEQSIVSNDIPYAAPVWVVGNNGERGVATTNWLAGLHATDAIISVGHPAARELPAPDVLARLRDAGLRVWRTDRDGTIRIQWQPARPLDGVPGYAVSVESDE